MIHQSVQIDHAEAFQLNEPKFTQVKSFEFVISFCGKKNIWDGKTLFELLEGFLLVSTGYLRGLIHGQCRFLLDSPGSFDRRLLPSTSLAAGIPAHLT